ncbi:ergothioneine biosynthesis protein EgtC [Nocardiopsis sp. SBT366]|uniref:ergothioneine biosynthesis protein EgtC n=1 Tax=Nocardiopsis sp. SBT366 TaxID=1580529 RepID=UPI00066D5D95|nr:ergothioneine biosynthesis protein EgtC [Nocardiopsis sp. SBT366]
MCRHLAYLGPPRTLHELLYAAPHSLHVQSWAPRQQRYGTVNADGFGVGWYPEGTETAEPLRYRRAMPIWGDSSFADAARAIGSGCVLAAVRDATVGFGSEESGAQPFRADRLLFSHNGAARDDQALLTGMAAPFPPDALDARAPVDSAPLFAHAVRAWRTSGDLTDALARAVHRARELSEGRYNLLASDGEVIVGTTAGDTLYTLRRDEGVWLASEPFDDGRGWRQIPENSVVVATREGTDVRPLG